ncbi:prepilin peptidase [Rhizobiales bacterium]|uniref:prepilin peptidase n=1 Tax=Hongsoonwoonella zoysiae TaxID=2821844 RepID=UPI00155F5489|nr:prepilin peptidase [Hongsoonwoonella zoysiae]NRG18510.1 prepilin peptidase [Hongsoonwoonella zoysiae]
MLETLRILSALAACVWLARILWSDFTTLKIRNNDILILLGILAIWLAADYAQALPHLGMGAIFFLMSFPLWLAGKLGAGDVKFLAVGGLICGFQSALIFALALLGCALLFAALYYWLPFVSVSLVSLGPMGTRLSELIEMRKVPYGVPIAVASAVALAANTVF